MIPIDELIANIFDDKPHPLAADVESWMKDSRRFRGFAESYRAKIRKKCRVALTDEEIKSLHLELDVARWLLTDSRCEVAYEKLAPEGGRTPDFTVTFRANTILNVEVTRMRLSESDESAALQTKVISTVCDKLGQMQTNSLNLVIIGCDVPVAIADVNAGMASLLRAAHDKNEAWFTARRFRNSADFLKQFQRLGGIKLWESGGLWLNKVARPPLPKEIFSLLNAV
ncbi:MAG: hypothetical protein K8L97_06825 [Anaerolineae bacterium]|nr:hypothetical protein [Anaerolineae bacterium]